MPLVANILSSSPPLASPPFARLRRWVVITFSSSLLRSHSTSRSFSKIWARSKLMFKPDQSPFDVHEVHEVVILVTASPSDTSSSISIGSPTLPIPEPSLHDARSSLGYSHSMPTVKFAPLPQIDPNRKRSLAPLGVPGRSRRMPVIQQESGSLLWAVDPEMPEETMEDPLISLAKFVKKTGKTLWRRVRKGSKAIPQENVAFSAEPVLDIRPTVHLGDMGPGERDERVSKAVGLGDKRGRRASWSPLTERRTLGWDKVQRKSTGDLSHLSVSIVQ